MDEFLVKAVRPFAETLLRTSIAENFFFLRYEEKGPHIRLRIQGEQALLQQIIRPNLEEHFRQYFEARPSRRIEQELGWFPDNSLVFIPYQPETERFGGAAGLKLAEQQFGLSSSAVLHLLSDNLDHWSYEDGLSAALQLHLGFSAALTRSAEDASRFFRQLSRKWLKFAPASKSRSSADRLDLFQKGYEDQKAELGNFVRKTWNALHTQSNELSEGLGIWKEENTRLIRAFRNTTLTESQLWPIFMDLVHLTNNRLGLQNQDESYLAYLLGEALTDINPSSLRSISSKA